MKDNPGNLVILDFYEETHGIRARFYCPPGYRVLDALNELIIRKESVQFVTADDGDAGRGFNPDPDFKNPRKIEKIPVEVDVRLKTYRLTGKMHRNKKSALKNILKEYASFIPMTDVTITQESGEVTEKPFAAVNRKFVVSIEEKAIEKRATNEDPPADSSQGVSSSTLS
jgi:hypothetical protein